jgi:heme o synthase
LVTSTAEIAATASPEFSATRFAALIETTKPGITRLVTITAGVGFAMAAVTVNWAAMDLLVAAIGCLVGTALSAAGANALNQWIERDRDARMRRTESRPLPRGQLTPLEVFVFGMALAITGVAVLLLMSGLVPALVSLATLISYLAIYTPSKPRTTFSTIIGAAPGAFPPLIGWTAASQLPGFASLADPAGWSLFLLMFVWQIPHFLSIAWMYKEDYAAGGHCVLPVVDASGRSTFIAMLVWTVCFLPVSLAPVVLMPDRLGYFYGSVAIISGLGFLYFVVKAAMIRTRKAARTAFIASVIHLPILLLAMVLEALVLSLIA